MGAIPPEIVHLLKVKLSLQNDQRWLLLLSWFSNFFGGRPPYPLPDLQICDLFFKPARLNTSLWLKSEAFNWRVKQHKYSLFLFVMNGLYIYWLKALLHPFYTIIYRNIELKIKIRYLYTRQFCVNLLFIFVRI